ncbi:hypothetical protein [Criblamydia sequanensis]|uniref:Membrane protein n=1 Tax=Candidatus Criblamydia sequanensis CRIB-18 TaxID=1437425 RepID=A0A090CYY6_9BACT|nr:hypothetical protein [Criblamydia sequanensis]CDR33841.1 putative membrane protein [Criblamydia sequanensis CRIB-18]
MSFENLIPPFSQNYPCLVPDPQNYLDSNPNVREAINLYKACYPIELNEGKLAAAFMDLNAASQDPPKQLVAKMNAAFPISNFSKYSYIEVEKTTNVAILILKAIGIFFLNVLTLGLFGLLLNNIENYKIEELNQENRIACKNIEASVLQAAQKKEPLAMIYDAKLAGFIQECYRLNLSVDQFTRPLPSSTYLHLEEKNQELRTKLLELVENKRKGETLPKESKFTTEWIPSAYKGGPDEPLNIDGKYREIVKPVFEGGRWIPKVTKTTQGTHVNNKATMPELISSVFDWTVDSELPHLESQGIGIRFNNSCKMIEELQEVEGLGAELKYKDNLMAIYKYMAFLIIDAGALDTDCSGNEKLILNNRELSVASSRPYKVKDEKGQVTILFKNLDDFSPINIPELTMGVDPVGCKRALHQLESKELIEAFKILLLERLIPEDDLALQKARKIKEVPKNRELFRVAEELIHEIAFLIKERYKDVINLKWNDFATDETKEPFYKGCEAIVAKEPLIEWNLIDFPIIATLDAQAIAVIESTKKLLSLTWEGIYNGLYIKAATKVNLVLDKNAEKALGQLQGHFHVIHVEVPTGPKATGCLFSALAISLFQGANQKKQINPNWIKEALLTFLTQNRKAWQEKVSEHTRLTGRSKAGWTVEQYAEHLQGLAVKLRPGQSEITDFDLGELELELFAEAFGIRVEVFVTGQAAGFEKGEIKSTKSFGPNTKEKIILFNANGVSFYALFPKLKDAPGNSLAKIHENRFWGSNNMSRIGSNRFDLFQL